MPANITSNSFRAEHISLSSLTANLMDLDCVRMTTATAHIFADRRSTDCTPLGGDL